MKKSIKKLPVMLLAIVLGIASCISTFASSNEKTVMEFLDDYQRLITDLENSGVSEEEISNEKEMYKDFQNDFLLDYDGLRQHLALLDEKYGLVGFSELNSTDINYWSLLDRYAHDFLANPDDFLKTEVDKEEGYGYYAVFDEYYDCDGYLYLFKTVNEFIEKINTDIHRLTDCIERLQETINDASESYSYEITEVTAITDEGVELDMDQFTNLFGDLN